jgi:hypothetical protein
MKSKTIVLALSLAGVLVAAPACFAQPVTAPNSPSASNETKGATTGLGTSHRFASRMAAQGHCGNTDPIVWSDGSSLTYAMPGSSGYGKSTGKYGFYACKSEADSAGFHGGD